MFMNITKIGEFEHPKGVNVPFFLRQIKKCCCDHRYEISDCFWLPQNQHNPFIEQNENMTFFLNKKSHVILSILEECIVNLIHDYSLLHLM